MKRHDQLAGPVVHICTVLALRHQRVVVYDQVLASKNDVQEFDRLTKLDSRSLSLFRLSPGVHREPADGYHQGGQH